MVKVILICGEKKTYTVIIHQRCAKALGKTEAFSTELTPLDKSNVLKIVYSLLILHLFDNALRQIDDAKSTAKI